MKEMDLLIRLGSGYYSKQPYVGKNERTSKDTDLSGAPNVNSRKIFVRKTIWDLEFSEHFL